MRLFHGCKTGKIHDTFNSKFSAEGNYNFIKRLEVYHNTDGIFGLFPFYNDLKFDKIILENSFYNQFKKNNEFNVLSSDMTTGVSTNHIEIKFSHGEVITELKGFYDSEKKRIMALKITTNISEYNIGKLLLLNNKNCFKISGEDQYFFPGFKTTYITDKTNCFLSSIGVYKEFNSKYHSLYFRSTSEDKFSKSFDKFLKYADNLIYSISRKIFIAFLITFPFIFFYTASQNILGGEIKIISPRNKDYILNNTLIHTDNHGFVHIKASNLNDGMFSIGFVHARDRLFQMDFLRRLGNGRLSEIMGAKTLEIDKFVRKIGLNVIAEQKDKVFQETVSYKFIMNYIDGINYYAKNFKLPVEYDVLNVEFTEFTSQDVVSICNYMSFSLTADWYLEIVYKYLEKDLGKEFADLVFSLKHYEIPFGNSTILNDEELTEIGLHIDRSKVEKELNENDLLKLKKKAQEVIENIELKDSVDENLNNKEENIQIERNEIIDNTIDEKITIKQDIETKNEINKNEDSTFDAIPTNDNGASNSWVLSGKYTSSGYTMLVNDPHLGNSIPTLGYAVKLYLPENIISGFGVPGTGVFLTFSNNDMSFAVTSESSDSSDFCYEKIEGNKYFHEDKLVNLVKTEETITVKDGSPENIEVFWTVNGPVINDVISLLNPNRLKFSSEKPFSFKISWYMTSEFSLDIIFKMMKAKKYEDFKKFIPFHVAPLLSLSWTSKKGDIGYTRMGKFPIKNPEASNIYKKNFCKGWSVSDEYTGFMESDKYFSLINPSKGFIVTANNRPTSLNYVHEYSGEHLYGRSERINQLIKNKILKEEKINIEDNINFLSDVKNVYAEYLLPKIVEIYERNKKKEYEEFYKYVEKMREYQDIMKQNPSFKPPESKYSPPQSIVYLEHLKKWNCTMEHDSHLASIWSILEYHLGLELLQPLESEDAHGVISARTFFNFVYSLIDKIHQGKNVRLKACSFISGSKECEKYIVKIIDNLDKYIQDEGDYKGNLPQFGEIGYQHYPSILFDNIPLLNLIFSKKVTSGGNMHTIKASANRYNNKNGKFVSVHGPCYQFVVDMKNPNEPFITLSTGNSGNIFSSFYSNRLGSIDKADLVKLKNFDFKEEITSKTLKLTRN